MLLQSSKSLNRRKEGRKSSIENIRLHGRKLINKVNAPPLVRVKEIDGERSSLSSNLFPPRWLFNEVEVKTAFLTFQYRLQKIEAHIEERNSRLAVPYKVLLPSRIPSGIAI